ncbi:hypothetical protein BJ912DRAFT_1101632 [Pholiota molesta]|nr:hypothetical protein BJ912DRAFT_1101632 [Pholiota molesta]
MDPPPATQISEPVPNIFKNSDGSPLQIFAEAGHIQNRPQLVRRLKKFGAAISIDPRDAQVILVNPESTQGRLFVRNWGHDTDKVVLDSAWAKKCFEAQKALLEDDEYGGYLLMDDGRPLEGDENEESEDEIKQSELSPYLPCTLRSPLPTPRATPIEPVQSRLKAEQRPSPIPLNPPSARVSPHLPIPGPSITPEAPAATPTFNGMDMAAMAQFMQQFAAPPPPTQLPLMMQHQAAMLQMFPFANPQQNMQNDPFWQAVRDTMMNKGLYPSQTQPPPSQLPHNIYSQPLATSPVQQQVLPFPPVPAAGEPLDYYAESSSHRSSAKSKEKRRAMSPSAKRRKTSSGSFQEASSRLKPAKTNGSTMGPPADRKLFTTRSGRELAFFVQVGGHNRFQLVQDIKKNGGTIVSNIADADYVILYQVHGYRTDKMHESFLYQAQSADLPAVPARFVIDCMAQRTLLDPTPYLFEPGKHKRKRGLAARSISPMSPESEDEDDVEEISDREANSYLEDRKRHDKHQDSTVDHENLKIYIPAEKDRTASTSSIKASTSSNGNIANEPSAPKKKRGRPRKYDPTTTSAGPRSISLSYPPSPRVPGAHTQVPYGKGFKFSPEENEFATAYAKVLIERDYTISTSAIGNAMYQKLPHHTQKSWRAHLPTLLGSNLDEWRKRAGIAFRKAQSATRTSSSGTPIASTFTPSTTTYAQYAQVSDPEEPPPSARVTASVSPPIPESSRIPNQVLRDAYEDDLAIISAFFAEGNDDQTETEEVIWAKLTAQARCQTEATWEEFYQKHSEEVQIRYQSLIDAQALQS